MKRSNITKYAVKTYGNNHQITVAIEELSELTKELCKYIRYANNIDNISEEIADVYIMLEQLLIIFDNEDKVIEWVEKKIERLQTRVCDNIYNTLSEEKRQICDLCKDWSLTKDVDCEILSKGGEG